MRACVDPSRGDREPRQARDGVPLPERNGLARDRLRGADEARAGLGSRLRLSATWISPLASRTPTGRARSSPGTSTSPPRTPTSSGSIDALAREDLFTVAIDLFPTDTVRLRGRRPSRRELPRVRRPGRVVLQPQPFGAGEGSGAARRVAAEPGDLPAARPSHGVRGARALRDRLRRDRPHPARRRRRGSTSHQLARRGTVPIGDEPVVQFADLAFPTPSGRVEIASDRAEADGLPRTPLPLADARPSEGRLRLAHPGVVVAPQRQLRERREDRSPSGRRDGGAAPGRCRGSRPRRRKRRAPSRTRPGACGFGSALRRRPARRRALPQGTLARLGADRRERERAEPWRESGHGPRARPCTESRSPSPPCPRRRASVPPNECSPPRE